MASLIDFLSEPVLKGFASASGLLVSLHTLDDLLGVKLEKPSATNSTWKILGLGQEVRDLIISVPNAVILVVVASLSLMIWYMGCKFSAKKVDQKCQP